MARPRISASLMRTAWPPRIALATPTPTNHMPSVAMKDGMRSLTWITPLRKPMAAPTASTIGMPSRPRSLPLAPLSTITLRITAPSASTPSTDRSIEPIRMMNVAPSPSTSGIVAAWAIRTKLERLRKLGLIAAIRMQSATSTATGAQGARRTRRRRPRATSPPPVDRGGRRPTPFAHPAAPAQPYWIWPVTRPQMSFQSSLGSAFTLLS